jgi:hypothetical protein
MPRVNRYRDEPRIWYPRVARFETDRIEKIKNEGALIRISNPTEQITGRTKNMELFRLALKGHRIALEKAVLDMDLYDADEQKQIIDVYQKQLAPIYGDLSRVSKPVVSDMKEGGIYRKQNGIEIPRYVDSDFVAIPRQRKAFLKELEAIAKSLGKKPTGGKNFIKNETKSGEDMLYAKNILPMLKNNDDFVFDFGESDADAFRIFKKPTGLDAITDRIADGAVSMGEKAIEKIMA